MDLVPVPFLPVHAAAPAVPVEPTFMARAWGSPAPGAAERDEIEDWLGYEALHPLTFVPAAGR